MTMHEGHNYRLTLIIFPMRTDSHPQGWAPAAKIDDVPPGFCSDASAEARKRSGADFVVHLQSRRDSAGRHICVDNQQDRTFDVENGSAGEVAGVTGGIHEGKSKRKRVTSMK